MADIITQSLLGNTSPRNAYIKALIQGGLDSSPVRSPWQGAARMAQALLGGLAMREEDQKQAGLKAATTRLIDSSLGGGGGDVPPITQTGGPAMGGGVSDGIKLAAAKHGVPEAYLTRTAAIESGGNPNAANPNSSARGPFQFIKSTAQQYNLTNPNDPTASADAAARFTSDNKAALTKALGREPTATELYLAHQQGAGGAAKLLTNPNAPAGSLVGAKAITNNGGDPNAPASQFVQQWAQRFGQPQQVAQVPTAQQPQIRSPQMTPQQRADLSIIMEQNPALGYELLKKYTTPKEQFVDLTPEERVRAQIPAGVPAQKDMVSGKYHIGQPTVSVNNQAESSFERTYGEGMSKRALTAIETGDKATRDIQSIQMLKGLLQNIQTGKLTPGQATMGAWMQSVGMDPAKLGIDPNLPATAEAATTLINKFALSNIGGEGGIPANNFSEADRDFILKLVPNLRNRPEANSIILDAKEREADLAIRRADAWADARERGVSYEKFEREWRKTVPRDIFKDLAEQARALQPSQGGGGGVRRFNPATGRIE